MNFNSYAIIGLQFGSEGKGALAGYLARKRQPQVVMSNWSPNAGHTFRSGGDKLIRRMIPIGAYVSPGCRYVLIGPGSIIDPDRLMEECRDLPNDIEVIIHPAAAVVMPEHLEHEKVYARIGSTMKGSAAAAIARMERDPKQLSTAGGWQWQRAIFAAHNRISVDTVHYNSTLKKALENDWTIQIEGCQGYSLSMYHGFYPYTTSRDTSIHQLLADIAWPKANPVTVYGAIRTYPIRVANRAEGTSGPCYSDQQEVSFQELGQEVELTTVTQLPRRIFTFSENQVWEACYMNGVDALYLAFCDYKPVDEVEGFTNRIEKLTKVPVVWRSWGPDITDMEETER